MADRQLLEALGQRLRLLRSERGVTATELARASGVGKATLSKLETGQGNPTVETLGALAAALQLPLGDLLAELTPAPVRLLRSTDDVDNPPVSNCSCGKPVEPPPKCGAYDSTPVNASTGKDMRPERSNTSP